MSSPTSALEQVEISVRVELGPSFIPNADIARNVCYPRTHQSQNGQVQTVTVVAQIAGKQTFAAYVATRSGRGLSELNSEV
jgi:hypothetical protein